MVDWNTFARHADVAAGIIAFILVGNLLPGLGFVGAAVAGAVAYLAVNRFYPPARK